MIENRVKAEFKRMRSKAIKRGLIIFLITCVAMILWFYIYWVMRVDSKILYLSGGLVILGLSLMYSVKLDKNIICPVCKKSLTDIDGWNVFLKECPHCNVRLR